MKLTIGEYTVDIKASANGRKANRDDLFALMNMISLWAGEASEKWSREGCGAIAKEASEYGNDIYNFLDAHGVHKDEKDGESGPARARGKGTEMRARIYGRVINTWYSEDEKGRKVLTQKEVEYKEYDTETLELKASGAEDFSVERWSREVAERWLYTWDGERRNKGGYRWFEDQGLVKYRKDQRNEVRSMMAKRYNAVMVDFRK